MTGKRRRRGRRGLGKAIDKEKVRKAITEMKVGAVAGVDGILSEFLMEEGGSLRGYLTR